MFHCIVYAPGDKIFIIPDTRVVGGKFFRRMLNNEITIGECAGRISLNLFIPRLL
jgi:hypothetical protein